MMTRNKLKSRAVITIYEYILITDVFDVIYLVKASPGGILI
jgi:hypothetical protein